MSTTRKQRKFKSHEPTTGAACRKSHQQVSMTCAPMKNTRFHKRTAAAAENKDWSAEEEVAKDGLSWSAFNRKHNLNEVSYRCKGRTGYRGKQL